MNENKWALTPTVVMLAIGVVAVAASFAWECLASVDWEVWGWKARDLRDWEAKWPWAGTMLILGLVLAVECLIIFILHRQPDTRRKVAWNLLSPTVTVVAAGGIIAIGGQAINEVKTDTNKINCQLSELVEISDELVEISDELVWSLDEHGGQIAKGLKGIQGDLGRIKEQIADSETNIITGVRQSSSALVAGLSEPLGALERQVTSLNLVKGTIKNAAHSLKVPAEKSVQQLRNIVERIEGPPVPQPLVTSDPDRLKKLKKLLTELEELTRVHRQPYERDVTLGERNFFKKVWHFFRGIPSDDASK